MKKNFFKHTDFNSIIVSAAIVATILTGTFVVEHYQNRKDALRKIEDCKFRLRNNADARWTYVATAPEITQRARLHRVIDSLNFINDTMLVNAQRRYYERIDTKYTLDKFFYVKQIEELNRIIDEHLVKCDMDDHDTYQYIIENTPMNAKTPLGVFESVARIIGVSPETFESAGVIFDMGDIFMFTLPRAQANFLRYLGDCEKIEKRDSQPNFDIPELAVVQKSYTRNKNLATRLDLVAKYNDSVADANLARFDTIQKRLHHQIQDYQAKLK